MNGLLPRVVETCLAATAGDGIVLANNASMNVD
jgi:hypothetical protein